MGRLRWLAILMGVVIVAITGFQVYWLKDTYNRERKTVELRVQSLFRETVREQQDTVLQQKLQQLFKDSSVKPVAMGEREMAEGSYKKQASPRVTRVFNLLKRKMVGDSLHKMKKAKAGVVISLNADAGNNSRDKVPRFGFVNDSVHPGQIDEVLVVRNQPLVRQRDDSLKVRATNNRVINISAEDRGDNNHTFFRTNTIFLNNEKGERFSIMIDSLFNDSISVEKLSAVFAKTLIEQKLSVPFTIFRQQDDFFTSENYMRRPPPADSFGGYKIQLNNIFSYLVQKISLPVLFSIFLVGLTILCFILLYRGLLRQYRLARIKSDLINNITHELKTPIATVAVAIEALKNFNAIRDPQKTKEYLDISQNELQRLGLLVDKVLKLSMFENKRVEIRNEIVDLKEIVNEVVGSLRLQLEKYNASIHVSAEGDLLITGDRLHLLSVMYNLMDNALKYSKGSATIRVDIKEEGVNMVLNVTDNGIGIPKQYKAKIFEKFFRVPTGDTHNAKGHGLGLSYAAQVVHQHKGRIEVESHEGLGSSFIITLPKAGATAV